MSEDPDNIKEIVKNKAFILVSNEIWKLRKIIAYLENRNEKDPLEIQFI